MMFKLATLMTGSARNWQSRFMLNLIAPQLLHDKWPH
jgi:hypothetical protein